MCHTLLPTSYFCLFSHLFFIGWSVFHPMSPVFMCLFAGPCVPDLFLMVFWFVLFFLLLFHFSGFNLPASLSLSLHFGPFLMSCDKKKISGMKIKI